MNRSIIKILFAATVMAACQPKTDSTRENVTDTVATKPSKVTAEDQVEDLNKPKQWKEFETVFAFSDTEVSQKLGVITLVGDSIEFRLLTEDNLCDTEYWGTARNFYPDGDPEIDEDDNGEGYEVNEFIMEDSFKIIKIRIADTNDKARITFGDKTETDTDCFPVRGLLLKRGQNVR